jgi:5-methylcytosine-specific restriction protein A
VLDVGRRTRTVSAAQRRALAIMYPTCQFPGCDRDITWCDIHHETPWVEGGRTDLNKLKPYCRPHHICEHQGLDAKGHDP